MSDEYKYHQIHHKGLYDYYLIIKGQKKYQTNSSVNLPKDDLTTKRVLTGPKWNVLTGRENKSFNKIISNPDFYTYLEKNKNLDNIFEMEKMTQRGNLPTSYDLRIRIDEPFNKTTTHKRNKMLENKFAKTQESKSQKMKNLKLVLKNMMKKKKIIH
jgi:phospholipid N-methyltransferase